MRHPKGIARTWLNKAIASKDSYDKFVYLWFAFNSLYNDYFVGGERRAIKDMLSSDEYRLSEEKINQILHNASVSFFKERIIRDGRGNGKDTSEDVAVLTGGYSKREKLQALVMILYQVRCNLFHGNKEFGRDSDDEVVENAANVLEDILRRLIRSARR